MSATNWIRRASGLFIPYHTLAPWKFLPCSTGVCCGLESGCYIGPLPNTVWIDIPQLNNNTCLECDQYEATFELGPPVDVPGGVLWEEVFTIGTCSLPGTYKVACYLNASPCILRGWIISSSSPFLSVTWGKTLVSPPIAVIDHILPPDGIPSASSVCSNSGTTARVYE
jgi:hypothetical protein